ncbi:MAG: cell division protein FtsL [Acidobacteriota bacterium]|nr:cell division protein FtsL [Acidobacteriota bacterium]
MATTAVTGQQIGVMSTQREGAGRVPSIAERNRTLFEAQKKARRGPTPEVFFAKHIDNSRIVKADDPERRRAMRQFTIVVSLMFLLVMVYVWQHFAAIEVGYHVESQKQQVEQLREENRQLRLNEAQLTDPQRIDHIAHQLGLDEPQPGQVIRQEMGTSGAPVVAQAASPVVPVQP